MHASEEQLVVELEGRQVNKREGLGFREELGMHHHHVLDGWGEEYHEKEE